ncbi:YdeI/OmpD-associated family protein [Nocardia sp. CDC153]|uniref:YdeI/OmpD-associated family protein n=1 Tax=Nocardia sp. CDC153 TaxID=3112167 RepID=UPI002DBE8A17|nr:YdeI/OmpD-associated family protein [Nocardia sp. CDC153]MEC3952366.1 YdeI/OmpD-associated family protein [Nocardia sp. CDC153]
MQRFEGVIQSVERGGAYIPVPPEIIEALGGGGRIPVRATFDGIPYQGSIANMGAGPCLGLLKAIQSELGKGPGDQVKVTIERDTAERTITVPGDLADALSAAGLRAAFDALSYTNRKEAASSVAEAKKPETRTRRIAKVIDSLGSK